MPRHYFSLVAGGQIFRDREGDELADAAAARRHAVQLAYDLTGTRSSTIRDWMSCSIEVRDARRRVLFVLPFVEALDPERARGEMPPGPAPVADPGSAPETG